MIKTYRANTNISINVVLASKKNFHVSFNGLSNGSSVYTTDNEEIQNAIERHYKFGKLFKLISSTPKVVEMSKLAKTTKSVDVRTEKGDKATIDSNKIDAKEEDEDDTSVDESDEDAAVEESTLRKVEVSDIATAKDYLAEKFGVSRTSMRSAKAIVEHAKTQGIEFVGL